MMNAENFIRKQIRKILTEKAEETYSDKQRRLAAEKAEEKKKKDQEKKEKEGAEEKKKKKKPARKIVVKGSVPGAPPTSLRGAKLLSDSNPGQLMANLKAGGNYQGKDDADSLRLLLRAALGGTPEMKSAFGGMGMDQDGQGREGVTVAVGEVDEANGTRYIRMVMKAAVASGAIRPSTGIRIQATGGGVLVYPSPGGNATWGKEKKKKK